MRALRSRRVFVAATATAFILGVMLAPSSAGARVPGSPSAQFPKCVVVPTLNDVCPEWATTYDNPDGHAVAGADILNQIALSPSGDKVFSVGYSRDDPHNNLDILLAAYRASTGEELWTARYDAGGFEVATGLAVSPKGDRVYVGGVQNYSVGISGDFVTLAFDAATGHQLWSAIYSTPGLFYTPMGLALSHDGSRLYAMGYSQGSVTSLDDVLISYVAATGRRDWVATYDTPGSGAEVPEAIAVRGPSIYLTGYTRLVDDFSIRDYLTLAYKDVRKRHNGVLQWKATYDGNGGAGLDIANGLAISPNGKEVVVTGHSYEGDTSTSADYATVAYDTHGKQLWATRYQGQTGANYTSANAIAFSPRGDRLFVTGESPGPVSQDAQFGTVAYDPADGHQLWAAQYQGPAANYSLAHAVVASADGTKVYVTGEDGRGTVRDAATLTYDAASGTQLRAARYSEQEGADWDIGLSMALSPDGKALYVGASDYKNSTTATHNSYDYLTMRYPA